MRLKKRPLRITRKEHIEPKTLEKNLQYVEEQLLTLDNRRIAQLDTVTAGATDADTIVSLLAEFNKLAAQLNASDLTNE